MFPATPAMYPHFGDARIVDLISLGAKVLLIFPAILKRKRIQPLLVIYHTQFLQGCNLSLQSIILVNCLNPSALKPFRG